MNMQRSLILLSMLSLVWIMTSCARPIHAQNEISKTDDIDKKKITETIETYFEGWMTGDTTLLGTAMHRTCQLKNIKDDDVIIYDRATYLSFFKPRPRRENAGGRIISINITDDIASAKCEIHTAG